VNSLHPAVVKTSMMLHDTMYRKWRPDLESPTLEDVIPLFIDHHALDVPWVEAEDVSNLLTYLASDKGCYITGSTLYIDAGRSL
jgi:(+)-trans-carveol dehydrogenase